jgi:hypothetical protein
MGVLILWLMACAPEVVVQPPASQPSVVTTQEGLAFYVHRLRLPGTRQELLLRSGGTRTWLPLAAMQELRFTGPLQERYQPALIYLTSGEQLQGEIFVGQILLEGITDLGYWNMPLSKVVRLEFGTD